MDPTKNIINTQKNHQIPEKSEEQIKQEAFMAGSPSRNEMVNYVQSNTAQLTDSFNIVFAVLQKVLVDKGLVTAEELEKAGDQAIDKIIKENTPAEVEVTENKEDK